MKWPRTDCLRCGRDVAYRPADRRISKHDCKGRNDMDVNATLVEYRSAISDYQIAADNDDNDGVIDAAERMARYGEALDEWITRGGYLPNEWIA